MSHSYYGEPRQLGAAWRYPTAVELAWQLDPNNLHKYAHPAGIYQFLGTLADSIISKVGGCDDDQGTRLSDE